MILLFSLAARAATITVDAAGGADHRSIQDAIDAARSGDSIEVAEGTYTENLDTDGKDLTITGASASGVVVDGDGGVCLRVEHGETVTLKKLTLEGGEQGLSMRGSTVTLKSVIVQDNEGVVSGAGIGAYDGSALTLQSTYVRRNTTTDGFNGGGVYVSDSSLTADTARIQSNGASQGAGIYASAAVVVLEDTVVSGNSADSHGGAMRLRDGSTLVATAVTAESNTAGGRGGVLACSDCDTTWTDAVLTGNESGTGGGAFHLDGMAASGTSFSGSIDGSVAAGSGGAVFASGHDLALSGTISGSVPGEDGDGGAVYALDLALALSDLVVEDHAAVDGGALYLGEGVSAVLDGVVLSGNTAAGSGGAVYAVGDLSVSDGTLLDNVAAGAGGALYVAGADLAVADSELSGNVAGSDQGGGGIYHRQGLLDLDGVTLADNEAGYGGGLILIGDGTESHRIVLSTFDGNRAAVDGGGLHVSGTKGIRVRQVEIVENRAAGYGGGMFFDDPGALVLYGCQVLDNTADVGGGLYVDGAGSGRTEQSLFGTNTATSTGGGAVFTSPGGTHEIHNDTFVENSGAGLVIAADAAGGYPVANVDVVGNDGDGLTVSQSPGAVVKNTIAFGNQRFGIYADAESAAGSFTYNDSDDNQDDWGGGLGELTGTDGNISADPEYLDYARDGDATADWLALGSTSPCRDAGDPELLDVDGSRSDIGSTGGPHAAGSDEDGDGYAPGDGDCDESDAEVHPGAEDAWYDGVDSDCDGRDDYDADEDGYRSAEELTTGDDCDDHDEDVHPGADDPEGDGVDQDCDGQDGTAEAPADDTGGDDTATVRDEDGDGSPWGEDCDDSDPRAFPGNAERCSDGVDNDCNGTTDANDDACVTGEGEGCGCAGGAGGGWWALGLAALALRRRRG